MAKKRKELMGFSIWNEYQAVAIIGDVHYRLSHRKTEINTNFNTMTITFSSSPKPIRDAKSFSLLRQNDNFMNWYLNIVQSELELYYEAHTATPLPGYHHRIWVTGAKTDIELGFLEYVYGNSSTKITDFISELRRELTNNHRLLNVHFSCTPNGEIERMNE